MSLFDPCYSVIVNYSLVLSLLRVQSYGYIALLTIEKRQEIMDNITIV